MGECWDRWPLPVHRNWGSYTIKVQKPPTLCCPRCWTLALSPYHQYCPSFQPSQVGPGPLLRTTHSWMPTHPTLILLRTYCVPGTVLGPEDTGANQTEIPALLELHYTQTHKSTGCVPLIGPLWTLVSSSVKWGAAQYPPSKTLKGVLVRGLKVRLWT